MDYISMSILGFPTIPGFQIPQFGRWHLDFGPMEFGWQQQCKKFCEIKWCCPCFYKLLWTWLCSKSIELFHFLLMYRGMDNQIFKNQYTQEKMIVVWLINPVELNLRQFSLLEKKDTWKIFSISHTEWNLHCNCANLPPWKNITWDKNHWKKS